ncbi:hypothetical protein HPP92_019735 [Vanilla planifolia]|uniref:Uncharacterized protein n=1 Tax=Vanilla planifolia TaxID=51239 RepID=A0A835Q3U9_VANPL|nr:hypothetical protein HPP92_019735 [Vanilla planifolia]
MMGNSLRLCVACVLPCGAFDVVRVVHINGHVEEYSRQVTAGEILAAHPRHVISWPSPPSPGATPNRMLIVSPDIGLRRGHIYFLVPAGSLAGENRRKRTACGEERRRHRYELPVQAPENKVGRRKRLNGRVAVWRPRLETIAEEL